MPLSAQSAIVLVPIPPVAGQAAQPVPSPLLPGSPSPREQGARDAFADIFTRGMAQPSPAGPLLSGAPQVQQPIVQPKEESTLQGPAPLDEKMLRREQNPDSPDAEKTSELPEPTSHSGAVEDSPMLPLQAEAVLGMFSHPEVVAPEKADQTAQDRDLSTSAAAYLDQLGKTATQPPDDMIRGSTTSELQPARWLASHNTDPRRKTYGGLNFLSSMVSGQVDAVLPGLMPERDRVPGPAMPGDRTLSNPVPDRFPPGQGAYQQVSRASAHVVPPAAGLASSAITSDTVLPVNGLIAPAAQGDLPMLESGQPLDPGPSTAALVSAPTTRDEATQPECHPSRNIAQVRHIPVDGVVQRPDEAPSHQSSGASSTVTSSQLLGSAAMFTVAPRPDAAENSAVPMIVMSPVLLLQEAKSAPAAFDRLLAEELATLCSGPSATPPRSDAMEARSAAPRPVVQQIIDASIRAIEGPVELNLSPEELGRVRISMTFSEASVTLNVHADRAETLELLRRHSEQLAQELRELGYGMISFSFGQRNRGQDGGPDIAPAGPDQDMADPLATVQPVPIKPRNETGLDIRV